MLTRFLGGLAVFTGMTGGLLAQVPAPQTSAGTEIPNQTSSISTRLGSATPAMLPNSMGMAPLENMHRSTSMPSSYLLPVGYQQTKPMKPAQAVPAKPAPTAPMKPAQAAPTADKPATAAPATSTAPAALAGVPCTTGCSDLLCCDPCGPCGPCGPKGRFWVSAEWIYWKTSGQYIPPLVTTAPAGSSRNVGGRLDNVPPSSILFGGQKYNDNFRSGVRISGGYWFDECQKCGIEGDFFYLPSSSTNARYNCDGQGNPSIFRPFFNTDTNSPDTQLVCFPDLLRGSVSVSSKTDLIGGGVNFVKNICCDPCGRFDLLLGYRYINLNDEIVINENLTSLAPFRGSPAGTNFQIEDRFRTENHFHGGVIGFNAERRFSHFYVNLRSSIALGVNRQTTTISGSTVVTTPAPNSTSTAFPGGLLTQPSNIGTYTQNKFAVAPEVGLKLGVQLTDHARLFAGYNYLYVSSAARAGDQIDLRVSPSQIAPQVGAGAFPAFPGKTSNFSAHGVSVGMEFRF